MHTVGDIGAMVDWLQEHISRGTESKGNLAVLHNQNDMVRYFGMSAWVTQSNQKVISRSVTSCAGMTAYMVVVAQTWVSFLSGGRGQKFRGLPMAERLTQMEEAYARATEALTRARRVCIIFGPLDMKGLIGAATVMASLVYGTWHCWQGLVSMHLRHPEITECPADEEAFAPLRRPTNLTLLWPWLKVPLTPPANVARFVDLVSVDLWRPWKVNQEQVRSLTSFMRHLVTSDFTVSTTPMMPLHWQFVYGCSLDGSDFPCYFLWPHRAQQGNFWLLESQTRRRIDKSLANLRPLGLQHFYDAFELKAELSIRAAAMEVFHLQEGDLSNDLLVSSEAAVARGWTDHFEQPIDQNAPEADLRNVPIDVISVNASEVDSESSGLDDSSNGKGDDTPLSSSESSGSEPTASEVSGWHGYTQIDGNFPTAVATGSTNAATQVLRSSA